MIDVISKGHCFNLAGSSMELAIAQNALLNQAEVVLADKTWYVMEIEHVVNVATDYYKVRCVELTPLRKLRIWHWRHALAARRNQDNHEQAAALNINANRKYNETRSRVYKNLADFHIRAVQALNDVVDGTAETDCHFYAH